MSLRAIRSGSIERFSASASRVFEFKLQRQKLLGGKLVGDSGPRRFEHERSLRNLSIRDEYTALDTFTIRDLWIDAFTSVEASLLARNSRWMSPTRISGDRTLKRSRVFCAESVYRKISRNSRLLLRNVNDRFDFAFSFPSVTTHSSRATDTSRSRIQASK